MKSYGPVAGSPLLPVDFFIPYLIFATLLISILFLIVYHKKRPVMLWYKIKLLFTLTILLNIVLLSGGSLAAAYWLIPKPHIVSTSASSGKTISPTEKIEITFDRPVSRSTMKKAINPDMPGRWVFEEPLYATHLYRKLVFYPTYSLKYETNYLVSLSAIENASKLSPAYSYQFNFKTQKAPTIMSVTPQETQIIVALSEPTTEISEFDFVLSPQAPFEAKLDDTKRMYTLKAKEAFKPGQTYSFTIVRTDLIRNLENNAIIERGKTNEVYNDSFTTKGSPSVQKAPAPAVPLIESVYPADGWSGVGSTTPVRITFSRDVNQKDMQTQFSISPAVTGSFSWEGKTLIFTPAGYSFDTTYTVRLGTVKSTFTTQDSATRLSVPAYLQQHALSCEVAALRMALAYRGVNVSEETLLSQVGIDNTPHTGNIWGNPYAAFVGNVNGRQMADGYGVYWGPIARVARLYRNATEFEGWGVGQLTDALSKNNPVVIWVYSSGGWPASWTTPDGKNVYAVRDEHSVTVVGFVGPANNPSQLIINDPLVGQVYWPRSLFDSKWNIFNRSGVVVY